MERRLLAIGADRQRSDLPNRQIKAMKPRGRDWPEKVEFDNRPDVPKTSDEVVIWRDQAGPLTISRIHDPAQARYRLRLGDASVIDVLSDRRFIVYAEAGGAGETHEHFLADQAIPRAMAHEGSFILHAGAIRVGQGAILLMGLSGRGKSTLVTSFDQAGFALLGDDAMVVSSLDATPRVRAVYPSLRLFPDSIDALMPGVATAGPVAHYSTKHRIDVSVARKGDDRSLAIQAIFSIAKPAENDLIGLRRLTIAETCMALVESSFALDPVDPGQALGRLNDASALARQVPAFEIAYPRDYARLPEVRQAILGQLAALEHA